MTIPHPDPGGYGPLGTPNTGREERTARYERQEPPRHRAAAARLDSNPDEAELRRVRQDLRQLREDLQRLRAELPSIIQAEVERILGDQLPEAVEYLVNRALAERNGQDARRTCG